MKTCLQRTLAVLASLLILLNFSAFAFSKNGFIKGQNALKFTENKGQLSDQNHQSRPDIHFYGHSQGMNFHLKGTGVSYQLSRVDQWKEITDPNVQGQKNATNQTIKVPQNSTLYRIDIDWVNANPLARPETGEAYPEFANYYLDVCPDGALGVKSYKSIRYKGIYSGIDLIWYEGKEGLEYDYELSPGADYRQIQMRISGAEKVKVNKQGALEISTPLGIITEKAPLVTQQGRIIPAQWNIVGDKVTFELGAYDISQPLTIDPVVRTWGTYYGGNSNDDFGYYCTTDSLYNVFMSGYTSSINLIASSGAHQSSFAGGGYDAFLVKFNSAGVREWGTFYGGNEWDIGRTCATDASGNVYLCGYTESTSGIATSGSHLSTFAGIYDAFLVKFDGSGVRQWGTYYGGSSDEYAVDVSVDNSGNIFLAGHTWSTTDIATSGSHQDTKSNFSSDVFLVKFDNSGVRQWGTYYGGTGYDVGMSCITDNSGNVFLGGYTASSTDIASSGAHQTTYNDGGRDAFLVQFDASGVRQWGTYYGGTGYDEGAECVVDPSGNVFLSGFTASTTDIASSGSHQDTHGGGTYDGFIVKFDNSGTRQWGTYYGGSGWDQGRGCATDNAGNVLLSGQTISSNAIATSGAYQSAFGGGSFDGFLVKFNASGTPQWGTYYGGGGLDQGMSCATNDSGYVFFSGSTNSGNAMASSGAHQTSGGNSFDGFLAKFKECNYSYTNLSAQVCYSYTLNSVTYKQTGNYTQTLTNAEGCDSIISLALTVLAKPTALNTISVSSNSAQIEWSSAIDPDSFLIRYQKNCTGQFYYKWVSGTVRQATLTGLDGCTDYCFRVRTHCTGQANPQYSSTSGFFTTQNGASCVAVSNVAISNTSGCDYMVSWSNCISADSFRVRYKLSSSNTWLFTPWTAGFSSSMTLSTGTWMIRVQTKCGTNIYSTTTLNYIVGSCRLAGVASALETEMSIAPNPTHSGTILSFNTNHELDFILTVTDLSGRVIWNQMGYSTTGMNQVAIPTEGLAKGVYFAGITIQGETNRVKFIIQ